MRVLALHPNQVKAARDRFRASGGKSDRFDRFVLCELARTDRHRFRILEPDCDQTKALRALVRAREDLVGARVALANQLRAELERFWPGPIGLFCDLDSPISLAFLARYPSPADARGLGEKRLAAFLKAHRYGSRKTAAQLLARLRSAAAGRAGERRDPRSTVGRRPAGRDAADDGRRRSPSWSHRSRTRSTLIPTGRSSAASSAAASRCICAATPALRDRRLPRPLSPPRRDRCRRRPSPGRQGVGQTQAREVPLGVQQAAAQRAVHPRPEHPHLEPVGR